MLWIACNDGITDIVATPHIKDNVRLWGAVQERVDQLREVIREHNVPVMVYPGAEVYYLHYTSPDVFQHFSINGSGYTLVEFPHSHLPVDYERALFNVTVNEGTPIIAHPERNFAVIENPFLIERMIKKGALIQLTAASITGYFGREVQACAEFLIEKKWVHLVGSDAHSADNRPPRLKKAFQRTKRLIGKKWAHKLFVQNPERILMNMRI